MTVTLSWLPSLHLLLLGCLWFILPCGSQDSVPVSHSLLSFIPFSLPSSHLPFSLKNLTSGLPLPPPGGTPSSYSLPFKLSMKPDHLTLSYCLSFSLTKEKNSFSPLNLAGSGFVIAISVHGLDHHVGPAPPYPSVRLFQGRGLGEGVQGHECMKH